MGVIIKVGLLYTLSAVGMFMATGLKRTSSDFFISASLTETVANTFETQTLTLPLNALDREVFVITGIILDPDTPEAIPATRTSCAMQLTRNTATGMVGLDDFNLIALSIESIQGGAAEFDFFSRSYGNQINESGTDLLDVVATPNMFLSVEGANNVLVHGGAIRIYGYRAKADVSVYSALIASELNA